jgi:hypothetical protein
VAKKNKGGTKVKKNGKKSGGLWVPDAPPVVDAPSAPQEGTRIVVVRPPVIRCVHCKGVLMRNGLNHPYIDTNGRWACAANPERTTAKSGTALHEGR